MSKFGEWVKNKKVNEDISPETMTSVGDLHLQSTLKKRVIQFLDELENSGITRSKSISLLSTIMQQFQAEAGLGASQERQAISRSDAI